MKRLLIAVTTLGGLMGFVGPASAADFADPASYDWGGLYLGAQAGLASGEASYANIDNPVEYNADIDGWVIGGRLGYRHQMDMVVLGLSGDLNLADINGDGTDGTDSASFNVNWFGSIDAQAGIAADRLLFYAIGGVAFAGIEHNYFSGTGSFDNSYGERTHTGFTVGGGINWAVTDNFATRLEARHYDFSSERFGQVFDIISHDVKSDFQTITLGFEFKL